MARNTVGRPAEPSTARLLGLTGALTLCVAPGMAAEGGGQSIDGDIVSAEGGDGSRQYLTGELLVEGVNQNNFTDGSSDVDDRSSQMWLRARLGSKLVFDDKVEAELSVVYDAEGGDVSGSGDRSEVEINDAYLTLKRFVRDDLYAHLGRQPVSWNLRTDYGAFLHDSRANKPVVTSWDGARLEWQFYDNLTISGFFYLLDEANENERLETLATTASNADDNALWGLVFDWQPDNTGDNRVFFSASATLEQNPVVDSGLVGDDLINYYAGLEVKLDRGFDVYVEGAVQDGDLDDDRSFDGFGASLGIDWHVPGPYNAVFGVQFDHLSGEDDPNDDNFSGFAARWEGVSDMLIVEHERYGELSEMLVGNLQAAKLKVEYGFFEDRIRLKAMAANYLLAEEIGGEDDFGQEFDAVLNWQYTYNVSFSAFGGVFFPGEGFENAAAANLGTTSDDDEVILFGANAQVLF